MKNAKEKDRINKQIRNPRDIIPPNFQDIRTLNPILKSDEKFNIKKPKKVKQFLHSFEEFPEWPSQEELEEFNKSQQELNIWEKFKDPDHENIFLPISLLEEGNKNIQWKRPSEYIIDYYITKEMVMRYPLKNPVKFKKFLYDTYNHETCPTDNRRRKKDTKKENSFVTYSSDNKRFFKTFFEFFDKNDFTVIKLIEKEEKITEDNENFINLNENNLINGNDIDKIPKSKTSYHGGSKIIIDEKSSFFNKWMSSIFQLLREYEINDEEDEPIWKKIYPQNNGIPFYNPYGRYWIKLNHKGKPRKIEIDDLMPCNKDHDCLLPRCQTMEEIWPVLLTKAILKLFSYKFMHQKDPHCVIGDVQIIHALSGYYAKVVKINENPNEMEHYIKRIELRSNEEDRKENNLNNNLNQNDFLENENSEINEEDKEENIEKEKEVEYDVEKYKDNEKNFILFFNQNYEDINEKEIQDKLLSEKKLKLNNSNEYSSPAHFLNMKKKGTITNKFLPKVPLEPIKLSNIINEKSNEILLRNSSMERSIANKISTIKRLGDVQKDLMDDGYNRNSNTYQTPSKKNLPKVKINITPNIREKSNLSSKDFSNILVSEDVNKTLKRASLFPQQSINDLNKIFSIEGNAHLFDMITNDYEEMNQILKRSKKIITLNTKQNISNIKHFSLMSSKEAVYKKEKEKEKKIKYLKHPNNSLFGMFYPVVEVFNTRGFNKIRFTSIDINQLKDILTDLKFSYKKANKEEKKDFLDKIIEIGNSFTDKINKKKKEMKENSKSTYLFKISNNCVDSPQLKIFCDLNEEEIEIIFKCFVYNVDFPPYEFYRNLSDNIKNEILLEHKKNAIKLEEIENSNSLKFQTPIIQKEISHLRRSSIKKSSLLILNDLKDLQSSIKKKSALEDNSDNKIINVNLNSSIRRFEKEKTVIKPLEYDNSDKKNLLNLTKTTSIQNSEKRKTSNDFKRKNNSLTKNTTKSFFTLFDEVHKMTTDEYLLDIYKDMVGNDYNKYSKDIKIKRLNIKGNWVNLEEIKKNFEYFVFLFKNEKLKVKSNINTGQYSTNERFNKSDDQLKIYLISLVGSEEKSYPENENLLEMNHQKPLDKKLSKDKFKEKAKNTKINKKMSNKDSYDIEISLKKEGKNKTNSSQTMLIEFCSNHGEIGDLENLNYFIVFDLYEIDSINNENIDLKSNKNDLSEISIVQSNYQSPNINRKDSSKLTKRNSLINSNKNNFNKNDSIFSNGKIKLISEDIQLKGNYAIYQNDNLEIDKTYLLYIKSRFAPFGYNLKILTQIGNVEGMSYDKYLITYGGMKQIYNINLNMPNLESNNKYLAAKFLIKFNYPRSCKTMESFMDQLKKNFFEIKINASLILNTPYDITSEVNLSVDFLGMNPEHLSISLFDIIEPYEVSDCNKLQKNNLIFKEIFFASDKLHTTLFIDISKSSSRKIDTTLVQKELESLKEVSENSYSNTSNDEYNDNENKMENDPTKEYSPIKENETLLRKKHKYENRHNHKSKNKLHCQLKIYEKEELIYSQDFYDYLIIPNIIFNGMNVYENVGYKSGIKEPVNFEKMTQFKIQCFIEGIEIPRFLKKDSLLDWKIQVYSTDTIGFVKDTTKEDNERALINSWEVEQAGRSQRAENSRSKFVEERKSRVDSYIQESVKEILPKLDKKKFLQNTNHTNIFRSPNPHNTTVEDILMNFSMHKNPLHLNETSNLNLTQDRFDKFNDSISINNNSILQNSNINFNKTFLKRPNPNLNNASLMQNNFTKLATSIIIDDNLPLLNEKLKIASDYYTARNNNLKNEMNIDNVSDINFDRSRSPERSKINEIEGNTCKSLHVSGYIKNFINQAHEESNNLEESEDIFKLKNCKINSKTLNPPPKEKKYIFIKPENKSKDQSLRGGRKFDSRNLYKTKDSSKFRTYNDKLTTKRNFLKVETDKIQDIRNSFMKTFNNHISKEQNLYHELVNSFDMNQLESYCNTFKDLVSTKIKLSPTLIDIKNLLSLRKDQFISNACDKNLIKTKSQAEEYFRDIKSNNWKVSEQTYDKLFTILKDFQK